MAAEAAADAAPGGSSLKLLSFGLLTLVHCFKVPVTLVGVLPRLRKHVRGRNLDARLCLGRGAVAEVAQAYLFIPMMMMMMMMMMMTTTTTTTTTMMMMMMMIMMMMIKKVKTARKRCRGQSFSFR